MRFLATFSNLTNIPFTANLSQDIEIGGIVLSFNGTGLKMTNVTGLNTMYIEVEASEGGTLGDTGAPTDSGPGTTLNCIILENGGGVALNETRILNPSAINNPFYAQNGTKYVEVVLSNSTMRVSTNLSAYIRGLVLSFDDPPPRVFTGTLNISEYNGFTKYSGITISEI